MSITHSERVSVALVIQHAKRMRRIICGLSTLAYKRHDFREEIIEHTYTTFV
jgi:hypothetical protein